MAWRFRKSVKIMPGVKLNFSSNGMSTTIGGRGASVNIGKRGTYLNTSIPGTGLSNRVKLSGSKSLNYSDSYSPIVPDSEKPITPASGLWYIVLFTVLAMWFFYSSNNLLWCSLILLAGRGAFHYYNKTKPVYESKPVYKSDRRYSSGVRIIGYKKVQVGREALTSEEIILSREKGKIRLAGAALILIELILINI